MSRDDPQMKIRLPAELKARIEEAAAASTRTLNAEVVDRLHASFNTSELGLAPTVARLERDLARMEVDRDFDLSLLRMLVRALRKKQQGLSKEEIVEEMLEGVPLEQWVAVSEARVARQATLAEAEAAFQKLKKAEASLRALAPEEADSTWEMLAVFKQIDSGRIGVPKKPKVSRAKPKL